MKPYSILAKHYDKFSQNDCDYESWSQYLCKVANGHGVKTLVDVACGTGKMTALLARQGYKVVGVDQSDEMLQQAISKCHATFVRQDMKKLTLPKPSDMAVVVNDGVNYLKQSEILPFFQQIYANLRDGAPFVFDVSSPYKLQNVLCDNVFYWDDDDATLLWTNKQAAGQVTFSLTLFERMGETYVRSDETHTQYVHTLDELTAALQTAGFDVVEASDSYGAADISPKSLRITIYAVKR